MTTPTQVARPWRATFRTAFQFVLAAAVLLPFVVEATGLEPELYPWLAGILAVAATFTRVMALPQVEAFLSRFAPWLAADPHHILGKAFVDRHRDEEGRADVLYILAVILVAVLILALLAPML